MPTFIALQCYRCYVMQVKQEKRSSNKWNCCVCNEKQSVRKVFARSQVAKDVRKFVQDFNFSRQTTDADTLAKVAEGAHEMEEFEAWEGADCIRSNANGLKDLVNNRSLNLPVNGRSKWDSYLPSEGCLDSLVENLSEEEKYVTSFPENRGRKRKCSAATVAYGHLSLHQESATGKALMSSNETNTTKDRDNWQFQASTQQPPQKRMTQLQEQRIDKPKPKHEPESKWEEFLNAEATSAEPGKYQGETSAWSVKSSNDWQRLDGLIKTELDELLNTQISCADELHTELSWDDDDQKFAADVQT